VLEGVSEGVSEGEGRGREKERRERVCDSAQSYFDGRKCSTYQNAKFLAIKACHEI